ncbi:hypothetical protein [Aeromonas media]|uniref:hypothetical protein n=1 Tax=Aeromonas media TaxID=651 RepID=UPI00384E7A25
MRIATIAVILLDLLTFQTKAECWVVANMSGYSASAWDGYEFKKDKISDGYWKITIAGNESNELRVVDGVNTTKVPYIEISKSTITNSYSDENQSVVTTWSIAPENKAIRSQVRINNENAWSQAYTMVGDVLGPCSP